MRNLIGKKITIDYYGTFINDSLLKNIKGNFEGQKCLVLATFILYNWKNGWYVHNMKDESYFYDIDTCCLYNINKKNKIVQNIIRK